jgi:hypothetical protein
MAVMVVVMTIAATTTTTRTRGGYLGVNRREGLAEARPDLADREDQAQGDEACQDRVFDRGNARAIVTQSAKNPQHGYAFRIGAIEIRICDFTSPGLKRR